MVRQIVISLRNVQTKFFEKLHKKLLTLLLTWGEETPGKIPKANNKPDRERFSVPHAPKDPDFLIDKNLMNENICQLIKTPPQTGVARVLENWRNRTRPRAQLKPPPRKG